MALLRVDKKDSHARNLHLPLTFHLVVRARVPLFEPATSLSDTPRVAYPSLHTCIRLETRSFNSPEPATYILIFSAYKYPYSHPPHSRRTADCSRFGPESVKERQLESQATGRHQITTIALSR